MSDAATTTPSIDAETASAVRRSLAELERRVDTLETRVAGLPDMRQVEDRVFERVRAGFPPPPRPDDHEQGPSFRDIALPVPSAQSIVATAKTTWALFEMLQELKMLFWTLLDRRYHIAWMTRLIAVTLTVLILTSHWWLPLSGLGMLGYVWDKLVDLFLGLVLFLVLSFETRRYKEWRRRR